MGKVLIKVVTLSALKHSLPVALARLKGGGGWLEAKYFSFSLPKSTVSTILENKAKL